MTTQHLFILLLFIFSFFAAPPLVTGNAAVTAALASPC